MHAPLNKKALPEWTTDRANTLAGGRSWVEEARSLSGLLCFVGINAEQIRPKQCEVLASSLWNTGCTPFRNGGWIYLADRGHLRGATERINYLGVVHGLHFRRT